MDAGGGQRGLEYGGKWRDVSFPRSQEMVFPVNVSRRKALSTLLKFMNYISRTNKKEHVTILGGDGSGGGERS